MAKRIPRSREVSVTYGMLVEFRDEIKYLITSKFMEQEAKLDKVIGEIQELKSELRQVTSDVSQLKGDVSSLKGELNLVKSDVHQTKFLVETQAQQSQIALDACRHVMDEMIGIKDRLDKEGI